MAKKTPLKTTKTTKKATKKTASKLSGWFESPREASTLNDVKTAVLLVSLLINAFVFIAWLVLRVTTVYDQQVYDFLFTR